MKKNLNPAISDDFMSRIMIKIMDNIIVDGNKHEAENNEYETYKIKDRPVDKIIE